MITYATSDDLTGTNDGRTPWLSSTPSNVAQLLRAASLLVALGAGRNPYTDAPGGDDAAVLRDATCAQVAAWAAAAIDPTGGAAGEQAAVKRSGVLTGAVEYDTTSLAQARANAVDNLAPQARAILQVAGLLQSPVPLFDTSGTLLTWGLDVSCPVAPYGRPEW